MARLELEVGTDVLLLESGDALRLEEASTFDETSKPATVLIILTNYQLDIKLLLENDGVKLPITLPSTLKSENALLLETGGALLIERSQVHSELTETPEAILLAWINANDLAELSESELTMLLALLARIDLAELSESELSALLALISALDLAELSETELTLLLGILNALDLAELSEAELTLLQAILAALDLAELSDRELTLLLTILGYSAGYSPISSITDTPPRTIKGGSNRRVIGTAGDPRVIVECY